MESLEKLQSRIRYLPGFGNLHVSEALSGILPQGQNAPQKVAKGLYAEQLTGTAFTAPRAENLKSWTYRMLPSVVHGDFRLSEKKMPYGELDSPDSSYEPQQMRWRPPQYPDQKTDFFESWLPMCGSGSPAEQKGLMIYLFAASDQVESRYFYNSDAEMCLLPWEGALHLRTEMGELLLTPGFLGVIPRGVKFQVLLPEGKARGYLCENFGRPFRLPELGPIGANGLANPRDFQVPVASFEKKKGDFELWAKFQNRLFVAKVSHSPLDVVAWHGNYYPYRYDLFKFNTIGSISYDHPDPSIFTVLTSPSELAGVANIDFVIFPPRWLVMEHSFRPPYFHRNVMSEFMGLICGVYDAKEEGFLPGGSSLHNQMSAHGPEVAVFEKASTMELKPQKLENTMAFMFESRWVYKSTAFAKSGPLVDAAYRKCWQGFQPSSEPL